MIGSSFSVRSKTAGSPATLDFSCRPSVQLGPWVTDGHVGGDATLSRLSCPQLGARVDSCPANHQPIRLGTTVEHDSVVAQCQQGSWSGSDLPTRAEEVAVVGMWMSNEVDSDNTRRQSPPDTRQQTPGKAPAEWHHLHRLLRERSGKE